MNKDFKKIHAEITTSAIHISVLKMQINPKMKVGFSTVSSNPEGDRKRILDKHTITWPKSKTRAISNNEIRDFFVVQLYPQWTKLLGKMSSDFIGYQQLLCYEHAEEECNSLDLSLYLPYQQQQSQQGKASRTASGKTNKSVLVLYSPFPGNDKDILKIATGLVSLRNELLWIHTVEILMMENGNQ